MALRRQKANYWLSRLTALSLLLLAAAACATAQNYTFEVRHRHWHGGAKGILQISPVSIAFEEKSKGATHSRAWQYQQIQQLALARNELHILTYEDSNWKLGRDREYVFDRLPEGFTSQVCPLFSRNLDQRFVAAVANLSESPEWKTGAKLTQGVHGTPGTLELARDRVVFDAGKREESRTWRMSDIENVSSSGPFDLTLTTAEKSGLFRDSMRQFHFQLQSKLTEEQFNELWRQVNRHQGLRFLEPEPDQARSTRLDTVP